MIASISGTLKSISKSEIVLEVNSIGYLLNVSSKVISSLGDIGSNLSMFTDLQVKDDKIIMYGFFNQIDQTIFRLLQSVQGVGPKAALSILSALVNLGYTRSEVFAIVMRIKKEFTLKQKSKDFTVGNIIPLALNALTQENKWLVMMK